MPGGRPTKYTPELLEAARAYVDGGWELAGDVVPTLVGLAICLGVDDDTLNRWSKDPEKEEFYGIFTRVKQLQHQKLVNGGLGNEFNPAITKMMLTKHGYSDKQEITGKDGGAIETKDLSGNDVARRLAFALAKGMQQGDGDE